MNRLPCHWQFQSVSSFMPMNDAWNHLVRKHHVSANGEIVDEAPPTLEQQQITVEESSALSLAAQASLNAFKRVHLALTYIENDNSRIVAKILNPAIFEYLWRSGKDVRSFVLQDLR